MHNRIIIHYNHGKPVITISQYIYSPSSGNSESFSRTQLRLNAANAESLLNSDCIILLFRSEHYFYNLHIHKTVAESDHKFIKSRLLLCKYPGRPSYSFLRKP